MWELSLSSFLLGLVIFAAGGAIIIKYQWVAENVAHGVSSYDRVKLFGLIACGVGLLIMTSLHTALLTWLTRLIFPSLK